MTVSKVQEVFELEPPDGGWGWIMLIGVAVNNIFNMSMISLFGLLYGDALEAMGQRTQGLALVLYTVFFVSIFTGPITGAMIKLTSPRVVAVAGACICTTGIFLSGFSTKLWHLVVTYGLILGLGMDFLSIASFVAINSYFSQRKNRAVGLSLVGTSLGQALMPHLVRSLLDNYGFRGSCMMLSALSLHGVAGCMLMQPVERHMKKVKKKDVIIQSLIQNCTDEARDKPLEEYENSCNNRVDSLSNKYATHPEEKLLINKESSYENLYQQNTNTPKEKTTSLLNKLHDLFGIALLGDMRFIIVILGVALCSTSITNFSMLYPAFLEKQASLDKQQQANCMSAVAVADVISRFVLPIFQDKYKIKGRWVFIMTCIWLIVTRQFLAYQTQLNVLLVMSALYGFGRSMIVVQRNIVISENCKMSQVPAAVGLGKFVMGITSLPLGWFLGWIRDYTGSYIACLTAQNVVLAIVLLTWVPDMLYIRIRKNKQKAKLKLII